MCGHGKGKEEVITIHTMKAYRRSGDETPLIFNLGKRWGMTTVF
jgi:hypothetical protein